MKKSYDSIGVAMVDGMTALRSCALCSEVERFPYAAATAMASLPMPCLAAPQEHESWADAPNTIDNRRRFCSARSRERVSSWVFCVGLRVRLHRPTGTLTEAAQSVRLRAKSLSGQPIGERHAQKTHETRCAQRRRG